MIGPPKGPYSLNSNSLQAQNLHFWFPIIGSQDVSPLLDNFGKRQTATRVSGGAVKTVPSPGVASIFGTNVNQRYVLPGTADAGIIEGWSALTMSCWCYSVSAQVAGVWRLQFSKDNCVFLSFSGATGYVGSGGVRVGNTWYNIGDVTIPANEPHLTAITYDGEEAIFYLDGLPVASNSAMSGALGSGALSKLNIALKGSDSASAIDLDGYAWDFRLKNAVASPAEMWEMYDPDTRYDLFWQPSVDYYPVHGIFQPAAAGGPFSIDVGTALEADTANDITPQQAGQNVDVGTSLETDTANTLSPLKSVDLGVGNETDTGNEIAPNRSYDLGTGLETDTGLSVDPLKSVTLGVGTEADTANGVTPNRSYDLGVSAETDSANDIEPVRGIALGIASETDIGNEIRPNRSYDLGVAGETDTANEIQPALGYPIGIALESDVALGLTASKASNLGLGSETDTANNIDPIKGIAVGTAEETDVANGITANRSYDLGVSLETDFALSVDPRKSIDIGVGAEANTANEITPLKSVALGVAVETSFGLEIRPSKSYDLGVTLETDIALSVAPVKGEATIELDYPLEISIIDVERAISITDLNRKITFTG